MEKMTIVIPYRDRENHLTKFRSYMQPRYPDARIVVIEQTVGKPFNRGKLLNIGVLEFPADYYALHDVDMLPVTADYSFPLVPTLLATKAQQFNYKMPYEGYFGGVVVISDKHMKQCNGFDNDFWGWGAEDDNFRARILATVGKVDYREGVYNSLPHPRKWDAAQHQRNVKRWRMGGDPDNGLSSCQYTVVERRDNHLIVDI
jgi:hypothetical protein